MRKISHSACHISFPALNQFPVEVCPWISFKPTKTEKVTHSPRPTVLKEVPDWGSTISIDVSLLRPPTRTSFLSEVLVKATASLKKYSLAHTTLASLSESKVNSTATISSALLTLRSRGESRHGTILMVKFKSLTQHTLHSKLTIPKGSNWLGCLTLSH